MPRSHFSIQVVETIPKDSQDACMEGFFVCLFFFRVAGMVVRLTFV